MKKKITLEEVGRRAIALTSARRAVMAIDRCARWPAKSPCRARLDCEDNVKPKDWCESCRLMEVAKVAVRTASAGLYSAIRSIERTRKA